MNSRSHLFFLKRIGWVLLVIGLVDIGVTVYCIANGFAYSSSLNIFAVVGGAFLVRGSLRAALIIRWLGVFMIAAFASVLVASPLLQPLSLTLTQLRLSPLGAAQSLIAFAFIAALLWWLTRGLGALPVLAAQTAAGRKLKSVRLAVAAGVALAAVLAISVNLIQRTESATRVISLTKQQLGPGFQYHVSSLNYQSFGGSSSVPGVVKAWNEMEVKDVPF